MYIGFRCMLRIRGKFEIDIIRYLILFLGHRLVYVNCSRYRGIKSCKLSQQKTKKKNITLRIETSLEIENTDIMMAGNCISEFATYTCRYAHPHPHTHKPRCTNPHLTIFKIPISSNISSSLNFPSVPFPSLPSSTFQSELNPYLVT